MKTTFTVPEVKDSKRVSDRNYYFALIGKPNYEQQVAVWEKVSSDSVLNRDAILESYKKAALIPLNERPFQVLQWSEKLRSCENKIGYFSKFWLCVKISEVIPK